MVTMELDSKKLGIMTGKLILSTMFLVKVNNMFQEVLQEQSNQKEWIMLSQRL
jgi:hypothetical protein